MSAVLDTQTVPEISSTALQLDPIKAKKVKDRKNYTTPSTNAMKVIQSRYSMKDQDGKPTEDWFDICDRVVDKISSAELDPATRHAFRVEALDYLYSRTILPNTPCLVNAGKNSQSLAACYVLGIQDSLESITNHLAVASKIHQHGGGVGQSYELLRPKGMRISSTGGEASGPVSFMGLLNTATEIVKQGGVRLV